MKNIQQKFKKIPRDHYALAVLFVILFSALIYSTWEHNKQLAYLNSRIALLQQELDVTADVLGESISETHSALAEELNKERQNVSAIKGELGSFQQEVGTISGTVDTLEKLSKTDPELLQKYSKVYFLSEHYTPPRLAAVDPFYLYYEHRPESVHAEVWPKLKQLLAASHQAGIKTYVYSGYRSFDEQAQLKGAYTITYGSGANAFSADQGYSEHQLGTTVDLITTGLGGELDGFGSTPAYQWLLSNAHKYGFILSYPPGNQYYVFEPWHWRYVGVELATHLKNTGKSFYDLDQREIDTYLISVF